MIKAKILIVDDEEAIREVVSTLLEARGYECASVSNGLLAQEYLGKHGVDLVLSDMVMPEMDGMRLVEWLHNTDPDIPIIMVTASAQFHDRVQAERASVNEFLAKPFDPEELVTKIAALAGSHRA